MLCVIKNDDITIHNFTKRGLYIMLYSLLYQLTGNTRFLPTPANDGVTVLLDLDIDVALQ